MKTELLTLAACTLLVACNKTEPNRDIDEYQQWLQKGENRTDAEALQSYLNRSAVGNVFPIRQILRSDTKWHRCRAEPFVVPPKMLWPHMLPTLRLIRDEVKPLIGDVEAQSVFRGEDINRCIKGASQSYHLTFHAIDMRPVQPMPRHDLIRNLCALHNRKGNALNMGLGIYKGTRFHIDTAGNRRWGHDYRAATSPCKFLTANDLSGG